MAVYWAYLSFLPIAALCFARLPLRTAILLVLIGGWWLLPVARYGPGAPGTNSPWWITGIALPSDMAVTKAWVPPLVAFVGAAVADLRSLRNWQPSWIDLPMAGWCLWPFIDHIGSANPPALLASLYVTGAWGFPWLIGRVWFSDAGGARALTRGIALSGLANLPVAIIEGVRPPMLYGLVYGPHPYRFDGIDRYVGYRPIGFLENGNLYGLWTALAAFAAISLLQDRETSSRGWVALAIINVIVALASQSVGAIILLAVGTALLAMWRSRLVMPALIGAAALVVLAAAIYLSGILPIRELAHTPAGEHLIGLMRSIGRGSFFWRISQDTKTLGTITAHPLLGTAQWDWWRPYHTRPWGQPILLIGQYGLIGLVLAWGSLIAACAVAVKRARELRGGTFDPALPLAIMVLLALADAALNAFFFSPAILAAGAIAVGRKGRGATGVWRGENQRSRPRLPRGRERVSSR